MPIASIKSVNCAYIIYLIPPINTMANKSFFIYVFPPPKTPQPIHMAYIMIMVIITPISIYFSSFTNDDMITFLPSSNMMVRLALLPASISTIVPSPKTLCLTLSPMSKSAIYLSNTTTSTSNKIHYNCYYNYSNCYHPFLIHFILLYLSQRRFISISYFSCVHTFFIVKVGADCGYSTI